VYDAVEAVRPVQKKSLLWEKFLLGQAKTEKAQRAGIHRLTGSFRACYSVFPLAHPRISLENKLAYLLSAASLHRLALFLASAHLKRPERAGRNYPVTPAPALILQRLCCGKHPGGARLP
jgi:hypothetical protein